MTKTRPVRALIGSGGGALLLVGLVDAVGTGLYLAGSVLFFTQIIGLTSAQVGLGLSVAGVLGLLSPVPFGMLADRYGPRAILLLLHLWCAAGLASYLLVDGFASFLVVAGLLGVAEQAARPINQALIEQVVGTEHRSAMAARMRVVYNVGYTVGALLAALTIQIGTRSAFLAIMLGDALSFLLCAAVLAALRPRYAARAENPTTSGPRKGFPALRDMRYVVVTGVNALLLLHMSLLSVGLPLWVTMHTNAPKSVVAVLLVVNTVLAVMLQVRMTRGSEDADGGARALRRASISLALCCVCFAAAARLDSTTAAVGALLVGVVGLTIGELWQSAGGWSLSYSLAPMRSRVEYLATFHLGSSAQVAVGPVLMTIGVNGNGTYGWAALAVAFLLAGLAVGPTVSVAARRPQLTEGGNDSAESRAVRTAEAP